MVTETSSRRIRSGQRASVVGETGSSLYLLGGCAMSECEVVYVMVASMFIVLVVVGILLITDKIGGY